MMRLRIFSYFNMLAQLHQGTRVALSTGRQIPIIGYGTWLLQGQDCYKGTKIALENGYTHIDTASYYKNEKQIKKALAQLQDTFPREKLYITSKINPEQQGYKESRKAVETILANLDCKYLDLILIHWPGVKNLAKTDKKVQSVRLQTWKTCIELQKEGKVRDIGVSNFLKHHLEHLFQNSEVRPVVNQIEIHPMLWQGQTIQFCRDNKIVIEAYSPLAHQDKRLFQNKLMIEMAQKYKKSIAQLCLRWCLQEGFVILPKSKTEERIKENIEVFDFQIDQADMKAISSLKKEHVRTCWDPNEIKY